MATNQILPFGLGSSANVYSYADWLALTSRTAGFSSGKASSQAANTAWRQASYMAYVLAQFISDNASVDVLDDGNGSTVEANLKKAIQFLGQAGTASYAADSSSTANALVVTLSPAPAALTDGMVLRVRPANSNTGATTVNVNGLGEVSVYSASGAPLVGGEIIANWPVELIYNALGSVFVLAAPAFATSNSFRHMEVLTSSTTWTVPVGVTRIRATVIGGGGGASGANATSAAQIWSGAGGGAGGTARGIFAVAAGQSLVATVGLGGVGGAGSGAVGGTSSLGTLCSATGGYGASSGSSPNNHTSGGLGGNGVGGQINSTGQAGSDGQSGTNGFPGNGGSSTLGGAARASSGTNGITGGQYGGGGSGAYDPSFSGVALSGGNGAPGVIIVEW